MVKGLVYIGCCRYSVRSGLLVLDEFYNCEQAGLTAVDRAAVRGNPDGFHVGAVRPRPLPSRVRPDFRDETGHLAVFGAPNVDTIFETGAVFRRLCIGDIQHVVPVDGESARAAKLLPLHQEISVRVEDFDTTVRT